MEDIEMDDVKTLLTTFRQETPEPDPAVLATARRRLVARTLAPERSATTGARWRPAVRIGVATGAVGAVAAGLLLVPQLLPGPPSASAAELLDRAADAAARTAPGTVPGPGDVVYVHDISTVLNGAAGGSPGLPEHPEHVCHTLYERWTPVDDADRPRGRNVQGVTEESARDPAAPVTADPLCPFDEDEFDGSTSEAGPDQPGDWMNPDPAFLGTLPTDARGLHDRARRDAVALQYEDTDDGTLALIADLAVSGSLENAPELRAALFRAIALVPGVDAGGTATTLLGDAGTVITRTGADGSRRDLIFDLTTGRLLGERRVGVAPSAPAPGVPPAPGAPEGTFRFESATRVGIVGAVGERPAT